MVETTLRGWKEIAVFLGASPRSAQRWERELGMPVHRLRITTGSVVTAYPSELDSWRRQVSAALARGPVQSDGSDDLEFGESGQGHASDVQGEAPARHRPVVEGRLTGVAARWALIGLLAVLGAVGAGWALWHRGGSARDAIAAGDADGDIIRVTSGPSTIRLRSGPDGMTTVTLPGVPEIRVRTERIGAELAVEVCSATTLPDRPRRLARLRLTPTIPAELTVARDTSISFAWEAPR